MKGLLRRTLRRLGSGQDKSMFAQKRRVIHPLSDGPDVPMSIINTVYSTDPMKKIQEMKMSTGGETMRDALNSPKRLEGARSRAALESMKDEDFAALIKFVEGANFDQMITGRRFKTAYEKFTEKDDVFVWLCMVAMAVLNPGDMRSRLLYRHLEALMNAVVAEELPRRTAFRFFETAVRSPAFREISRRQLEGGSSTRLAGLCAAAENMRRIGACRRPLTSYFELYQRITERSEAMTPWGFPPLFQFEGSKIALEKRLQFFARSDAIQLRKRKKGNNPCPQHRRLNGPRIFWMPPTWITNRKWVGPWYTVHPSIVPD